jgi:hypothetical protein
MIVRGCGHKSYLTFVCVISRRHAASGLSANATIANSVCRESISFERHGIHMGQQGKLLLCVQARRCMHLHLHTCTDYSHRDHFTPPNNLGTRCGAHNRPLLDPASTIDRFKLALDNEERRISLKLSTLQMVVLPTRKSFPSCKCCTLPNLIIPSRRQEPLHVQAEMSNFSPICCKPSINNS